MKLTFYFIGATAMAAALLSVSLALAKTSSGREVESATNPDGSALRIVTTTDARAESRHVKVYYRARHGQRMQLIWKNHYSFNESYSMGITQITDWNQDGINDVSVTLDCGTGADCEVNNYMIDLKTQQMVHVGTTGLFAQIISGYLVDMNRNNCCSWIGNAYRMKADRQGFEPAAAFSVFVAADKEFVGERPAVCYFYKTTSKGEQVIPAPTKALKKLCRWYK